MSDYSYEETKESQDINTGRELLKDSDGRYYIQGKRKKTYILNISGMRFGRLVAVSPVGVKIYTDDSKKVTWLFKCDCGKEHVTTSNTVVSGKTQSCGCLHSETSVANSLNSREKIRKEDAAFLSLLSVYKSGAKKRGLPFELSKQEFKELTSQKCHYCGVEPSKTHTTKFGAYRYNGVDRKDNEQGYTKENSLSCCHICNHAKATMSYGLFVNWILDAASNLKKVNDLQAPEERENSITGKVIEDLKAREKAGYRKYGRYLTCNSEEDMLEEVYQELLDANLYFKALIEKNAIIERNKLESNA